jgi:hypothetical protein
MTTCANIQPSSKTAVLHVLFVPPHATVCGETVASRGLQIHFSTLESTPPSRLAVNVTESPHVTCDADGVTRATFVVGVKMYVVVPPYV